MKNPFLFLLLLISLKVYPQTFEIRGVLPWHNFLSGPTAWNEADYEKYLDECQKNSINLIAFHNYTGGGERYFNYVEPMIKIRYKNVLPAAFFDNSGTARWGYLPMKVSEYAYETGKLFKLPEGAEYFGADCSITALNDEERYEKAQNLMKRVLMMAHERNIQMAMGFEFGVAPPEYASIRTTGDMYWHGDGSLVYNPFDSDAAGVLYATIDDILETYNGIDWIYLWLNEHCMFGVDIKSALGNNDMKEYFTANEKYYYSQANDESLRFLGVWAQAYIRKAYDYIKKKSPSTKIVIGGWGSGNQLASLLVGLDKSLPEDIVFSMLNPAMGEKSHPAFFAKLARNRKVWAIPWLEGDASLWHLQPKVALIKNNVIRAGQDSLNGVLAIHWRTEEIRNNFETFSRFATDPGDRESVEGLYTLYCSRQYGRNAAKILAPLLTAIDTSLIFRTISSPVYFAYTPSWGRLNSNQAETCVNMINNIVNCLEKEKNDKYIDNLKWLRANFEFTLLLDSVGKKMEPAWEMRNKFLRESGLELPDYEAFKNAEKSLYSAPIKEMFSVFSSRIRSRGELGELSSLNQRVWREYLLLNDFLSGLKAGKPPIQTNGQ